MVKRQPSDDGGNPPPKKKPRYNLRKRKATIDDGTKWIDDDTLPEEESGLVIVVKPEEDDDDSDYVDEISPEEFVKLLTQAYHATPEESSIFNDKKKAPKAKKETLPIKLSRVEEEYYKRQSPDRRKTLLEAMSRLTLEDTEVPHKFKVLDLPITDYTKCQVIKKINVLSEMSSDGGESHKLRTWIDAFLRVPFGKTIPLPVKYEDGQDVCTKFMVDARKKMDEQIYGMVNAKTQIMQMIAQWLVNPDSVGNVIALKGDPGIGKTSFARNAIASVLQRPFEFFSLGGSSDISNFVGHSYTYEGSLWGRIADSLMRAGIMNPVLYFDELDKISTTPQGEEIASMLIHLTDRSQNSQFHDRYFSGIDFDLSQCLFVFSFNDIDKVHPILRDRMTIINCSGYSDNDKKVILKRHIFPQILERLKFKESDIVLKDDAIKHILAEFSSSEKGVRNLIRSIETIMTRLNMLRVSQDETMKDYGFYMEVSFPFELTEKSVSKLLFDFDKKEPETWRHLYN